MSASGLHVNNSRKVCEIVGNEMDFLRTRREVRGVDKMETEEIRARYGNIMGVVRIVKDILKWYGCVERMTVFDSVRISIEEDRRKREKKPREYLCDRDISVEEFTEIFRDYNMCLGLCMRPTV